MYQPTLRFELETLRHTVQAKLQDANNDISKMIEETLNSVLTEDWIKEQVDEAVREALNNAIKELSDDHNLKAIFKAAIIDLIDDKLNS